MNLDHAISKPAHNYACETKLIFFSSFTNKGNKGFFIVFSDELIYIANFILLNSKVTLILIYFYLVKW